jgi:hypothetical protein
MVLVGRGSPGADGRMPFIHSTAARNWTIRRTSAPKDIFPEPFEKKGEDVPVNWSPEEKNVPMAFFSRLVIDE